MNRTRRLVRLHLMLLLIILLPFAGFLANVINHHPFVYLLAFVCAVLVICIESIIQLSERENRSLQLRLMADKSDLNEWKKKVRELDGIVTKVAGENELFRSQVLNSAAGSPKVTPE